MRLRFSSGLIATAAMGLAVLLAPAGLAAASMSAGKNSKDTDAKDSPPVLVSKGEPGPAWKTTDELKKFAAKGDPQACFQLADLLSEGTELPRDYEKARTLFLQAAQGGVANAWFRLGKMYHDGLGGPVDYPQAFAHFSEAARRGVPEGEFNIGAMLVSARGVQRDYVEGLAWMIVAGKSGAESAAAEEQVRQRLAKHPADIAAAEARAAEILRQLKEKSPELAPRATFKGEAPQPPATPALPPPKVEAPKPPKVELPVTLPPMLPPPSDKP